jgi:hypothetical protein
VISATALMGLLAQNYQEHWWSQLWSSHPQSQLEEEPKLFGKLRQDLE